MVRRGTHFQMALLRRILDRRCNVPPAAAAHGLSSVGHHHFYSAQPSRRRSARAMDTGSAPVRSREVLPLLPPPVGLSNRQSKRSLTPLHRWRVSRMKSTLFRWHGKKLTKENHTVSQRKSRFKMKQILKFDCILLHQNSDVSIPSVH